MKRINILFIFILVFRPQLSPNKVIYWKSTGRWLWNTTTT